MMRKNVITLAAVVCCITMATVQTACTSGNLDNPTPTPQPYPENVSDVTIMWYGTGGGNVDMCVLQNFRQFYNAKAANFDRVNVVAMYKNSLNPNDYEEMTDEEVAQLAAKEAEGKTEEEIEAMTYTDYYIQCHPLRGACYRFAVDPNKTLRQQLLETKPYGEKNCDFTCPDSLTNFINWAAQNYPAKKYILVMADHGGGYTPNHDLPQYDANSPARRGLVYDDGHEKKCFSAKSFTRAVRNANVRPEGIVLYLCLMNNMEFLYEVKDVTDYIVCSTYVMYADGGALNSIVDNMATVQDTEAALAIFVDDNVDSWDAVFYDPQQPDKPDYYDLTLTRTECLNRLAPVLREVTDRLIDTYQNGTPEQRALIDQCTAEAVKVENTYPFYDMAKYMENLFLKLPDVFDQELFNRLKMAFNGCISKQRNSHYLTSHNYQVDYSVMLGMQGNYMKYFYGYDYDGNLVLTGAEVFYPDGVHEKYKYVGDANDNSGILSGFELEKRDNWGSTFAETYQQSTFDHLVGWSRWLMLNTATPPAWSPSSFNFKLPDGDVSGNPSI